MGISASIVFGPTLKRLLLLKPMACSTTTQLPFQAQTPQAPKSLSACHDRLQPAKTHHDGMACLKEISLKINQLPGAGKRVQGCLL
jgi:hypothetical protein